jgi:hypothetical protein
MAKTNKTKKRSHHRKRPIAVTIIALLLVGEVLLRLYWVGDTVLDLDLPGMGFPWPLWEAGGLTAAGIALGVAAFRLLWALVGLAVLIGLLRMRRWSWVALVVWVGFSLALGLLHYSYRSSWAFAPSDFAVLAADMLLAFALNQSDVQRIYGIRRDDVEPDR